jgi:hypothetical protein
MILHTAEALGIVGKDGNPVDKKILDRLLLSEKDRDD